MERDTNNGQNDVKPVVSDDVSSPSNIEKASKFPKLKVAFHWPYFGYNLRVIIGVLIIIISTVIIVCLNTMTFKYSKARNVNYNETPHVSYKVYLKDNNFYQTDYLDEGMIYVANLIDKIKIEFKSRFNIDDKVSMIFDYNIGADLIIADSSGSPNYFQKHYVLLDNTTVRVHDEQQYDVIEHIDIDYDFYNNLANSFKNSFAVATSSYLKVSLRVNARSLDESLGLSETYELPIMIPLSERSIEIKKNKEEMVVKTIAANSKLEFNSFLFIIEVLLIVLIIVVLVKLIKLLWVLPQRKNAFDKYIEKILRDYDRLIVETTTRLELEKYHIFKINKFEELLDVRDNLHLPIMYHLIAKHQKCYFYIKNHNDLYLYKLKSRDLEAAKDK